MKPEVLSRMDQVVRKAGSHDPEDVLESLGYIFIDPGPSINGFITRRKGMTYYGVSSSLIGTKRDFALFHEGFHGLCGHLDTPGFLSGCGLHAEQGNFADYKLVADTERDANIGAADQVIDTETILDMLGYDSEDVKGYRQSVRSFEQAMNDYQSYYHTVAASCGQHAQKGLSETITPLLSDQRLQKMAAWQEELSQMYQKLQEQAQDISNSGIYLTKEQIARQFDVPEYIIDYKFRALEMRHYHIPSAQLHSFGQVFRQWKVPPDDTV